MLGKTSWVGRGARAVAVCAVLGPAVAACASVIGLGAAADYAALGLNNGTMIVNSAGEVTGDLGYSSGCISTTNQKIGEDYPGQWTGAAYVHSGATFMPAAERTAGTCIIVVGVGEVDLGIVVDQVCEVVDIAAADVEETPSFGAGVDTRFILGIGKAGDKVTILLDIDKTLTDRDVEAIAEAAA